MMIDDRKGEEKRPVKPGEAAFPQSHSKPENRPKLPSQKQAPKQCHDN